MESKARFLIIVALIIIALCCLSVVALGSGWWLYKRLTVLELTPTPEVVEKPVTASPSPSEGGVLNLMGAEPVTLDPALVEDAYSAEYIIKIFSGLVGLDENLKVVPELAEKWDVSDDGTVYTFYLRKDAVFHDGKPVTAQDFKYSLERACDPRLGSNVAGLYLNDIVGVVDKLEGRADEIKGVQVVDEHTLRITIDSPKAYFLAKLTYPVAFVVDKENVESGEDWTSHPNGTGPFKLVKYDDEGIVLEAFDDFYGGRPLIDRVNFIFPKGSPLAMYQGGELDAVPVSRANIEQVLDPSNPLNKELSIVPSLDVMYLGFNVKKPPFEDVKVRRAFAYATNRKAIVNVLYKKMVVEAKGVLPPGMPGYNKELEGIPYDPEKARELLAESSYGGPEELPPITLSVSGSTDLAEALAKMYGKILGVEIEIEQLPWDLFLQELNKHSFQMFILGWNADYPDPQNFLDVHFYSKSEGNNCQYANPEVDRLLEQARVEADSEKRMELYRRAEEMIVQEAPWVPLFHGVDYTLIKPYVKDLVITPQGTYYLRKAYLLPH